MRFIRVATLATLAATGFQPVSAQTLAEMAGSYTAVVANNFGPAPKGSLMLDANGRFSIVLMRNDLPKFAGARTKGTPEEYKATVEGSLAYYGSYTVKDGEIFLHIEASTYPNWNGTEQKRTNLTVSGDEIKYTSPTPSAGGAPDQLVWKRIK